MTDPTAETPGRRFTGGHMLALVCGFFGVVIAVNLTMALFATGSWTGLVVKNSYVASQHFNEELMNAAARKMCSAGRVSWPTPAGKSGSPFTSGTGPAFQEQVSPPNSAVPSAPSRTTR